MSGDTKTSDVACTPLACICMVVFPVIAILLPLAAISTVLLSSENVMFSFLASLSAIMVVVQPVSGVADTWNCLPPFSCDSQRINGGVALLLRIALAYSGGDSVVNSCSSRLSATACFAVTKGLPMPRHAFVRCPGLLHFPHVTDSFLILHSLVL